MLASTAGTSPAAHRPRRTAAPRPSPSCAGGGSSDPPSLPLQSPSSSAFLVSVCSARFTGLKTLVHHIPYPTSRSLIFDRSTHSLCPDVDQYTPQESQVDPHHGLSQTGRIQDYQYPSINNVHQQCSRRDRRPPLARRCRANGRATPPAPPQTRLRLGHQD